jgi:hypothetical protein
MTQMVFETRLTHTELMYVFIPETVFAFSLKVPGPRLETQHLKYRSYTVLVPLSINEDVPVTFIFAHEPHYHESVT